MAEGAAEGRVRLGVPDDLVSTYLVPVLKAYSEAFPRVEVSLVCGSSPELAAALAAGQADLALVEEQVGEATGECLSVERLVWVSARGGVAPSRRPLPVSLAADTCAFRPAVLEALREHDLRWRTVFEGSLAATTATVQADLAVTAWLASIVPPGLDILPAGSGLPELPHYAISLRLPPGGTGIAGMGLARCIRDGLMRRRQAP
jgi:DNA-binding transcriptional LysR family regulator